MTATQTSPGGRRDRELDLAMARLTLADFVRAKATDRMAELGFGWVGQPDAPNTYQQLRGAFAESMDTREPMPVSSLHCDATVYFERDDNLAFRFWHDTSHVIHGLSFRLEDELELALWHLDQLVLAGHLPDSLVYRVLQADLLGQLYLMGLIGRFPLNQCTFVSSCIDYGLDAGLLEEIRRVPGPEQLLL